MKNYSVFDAHCDTLCLLADTGGNIFENTYNADIKRMSDYKSYTQVFACFISPEHYNDPMARFKTLKDIYSSEDFGVVKPVLSLEGGEVIRSLEDVEYLKACGIRCATLTWNNDNALAGGVLGAGVGLTPFGKSVVRKMNELGIIVDVSHLSDKSFYDVASVAGDNIIATHSNSRSVCPDSRNLTDEMFRIIKESGGCVGINLYPLFVTGKNQCTSFDVIKHIRHFADLGGIDAIGIGSDFDGTDNFLPCDIRGCDELYRLFDNMLLSGFSRTDIEKISHLNFERIFKEAK